MPPNGFDDFGPHRSPPPPPPSSPPSMPPLTASSSSSNTSFSLSPINRNSTNNTSKGSLTTLARRLVIHPEVRIGSTKDSYPANFNLDPMDGVYIRPSTDPWGLYGDPHNPVEPYPLPTWDNPDAEEDEGGGWVHFESNPPEGEGEFDLQAEAEVLNAEFEREQGAIARGEIVRGRKKWVYGTFWARDDKRFMKKDDGFFGAGGNGNGYGNGSSGPILRLRGPRPENNNRKGSPPPGYYSGDRDRDGDVEMGDVITVKPKAAIQYGTRRSDRNRNWNKKKERASMEDERRIGFIEIEGPKLETTVTSSTDDGGEDDSDDGSYTPTGSSGRKKTNSKDKKNKGHTNSAKKSKDNDNGSTKRRRHSSYEKKETRVGVDDSSWAKSTRKAGGAKAVTQGPYGPPPGPIKAPNFYGTPGRGNPGDNGSRSSMPPPPLKSGNKWHRGSRGVRSDDEGSSKTKHNKRSKQKQSSDDEAEEAENLNLKLRQVEVEVDDAERQKRVAAAEARRNNNNNSNRGKAGKNYVNDDGAEMKGKKGGGLGMKMKDRMGGKPNTTSTATTTGGAGGKEKKGKENTGKGNDGQDDEDEEGNGDKDMRSLD